MGILTKTELLEMLVKLLQTDRYMNFLLSLEEKDLTTLLVAFRERIENKKSLNLIAGCTAAVTFVNYLDISQVFC